MNDENHSSAEILQQIQKIQESQREIKILLKGTQYDEKGLVGEVKENKREVRKLSNENVSERLFKLEKHSRRIQRIVYGIMIAGNILILLVVFWSNIVKIVGS